MTKTEEKILENLTAKGKVVIDRGMVKKVAWGFAKYYGKREHNAAMK
jgi:hypothetical protein